MHPDGKQANSELISQMLSPVREWVVEALDTTLEWHDVAEGVIVPKLRQGIEPTPEEWIEHANVEKALFYLEAAATPAEWKEACEREKARKSKIHNPS